MSNWRSWFFLPCFWLATALLLAGIGTLTYPRSVGSDLYGYLAVLAGSSTMALAICLYRKRRPGRLTIVWLLSLLALAVCFVVERNVLGGAVR